MVLTASPSASSCWGGVNPAAYDHGNCEGRCSHDFRQVVGAFPGPCDVIVVDGAGYLYRRVYVGSLDGAEAPDDDVGIFDLFGLIAGYQTLVLSFFDGLLQFGVDGHDVAAEHLGAAKSQPAAGEVDDVSVYPAFDVGTHEIGGLVLHTGQPSLHPSQPSLHPSQPFVGQAVGFLGQLYEFGELGWQGQQFLAQQDSSHHVGPLGVVPNYVDEVGDVVDIGHGSYSSILPVGFAIECLDAMCCLF